MNVRGAALHALGDALNSIAVIIAAVIIWVGAGSDGDPRSYFNLADPICSLLFAVMTLWTTKGLFVEVFGILMERAPKGMHTTCIRQKLEHLRGVLEVQGAHIWCISNDRKAISAHLVVPYESTPDELFALLQAAKELASDHGFTVSTFELVRGPARVAIRGADDDGLSPREIVLAPSAAAAAASH
jgi:zinc transporter 2